MKQHLLLFAAILLSISSDIFAQVENTICRGDGGIIFYPERQSEVDSELEFYTIKGLVVDERGDPLLGATIFSPNKRDSLTAEGLSNLKGIVITDRYARFSIDIEGRGSAILDIAYLGFEPIAS